MTRTGDAADLVGDLLADLAAERAQLRAIVDTIESPAWFAATPSPGWSVRDQIAHLAFFDQMAVLAVADPTQFSLERAAALADTSAYGIEHLRRVPARAPALLTERADAADSFHAAVHSVPANSRVPWYGPHMSLASMVSARLMEHWAHGHDVAAALGVQREPTDRLRHVATLAVRARGYGYVVRDREPSSVPVRVELTAPSGESWTYGPPDAPDRISGGAADFCLVLVRRRHPDDTELTITGAAAREWLEIGQAYAGQPGAGPARR
ncbi:MULTISPECIES: TIGR03084 family metal-binding protein [unclassified Pseudonocardia]|uniref:TIGR03084 family metal-binding protein n=1 Tax=unclassified Pseudonocardia TaxID=2619320 RepID=UPI000527A9EB|nr:TIGR03084 family metal-binding protein [Pseudonocardia sp. Ae707_Ps1]OLM09019.1 hypothetical protein Ae707Ps1_5966c [Pseudonocardia sp. Ae707_Ps1]